MLTQLPILPSEISGCYCKVILGCSESEGESTFVYFISSQWTFCQVKWKNYQDKNHQLSQTTETKPGHFLFVNIFYFNIPDCWILRCHTGDQGDNLIRLDIPGSRTIRPLYLWRLWSEYSLIISSSPVALCSQAESDGSCSLQVRGEEENKK